MDKGKTILIAEDDPDDAEFIREALSGNHNVNSLIFVRDGDEAIKFLERRGKFKKLKGEPLPDLVILDLNMPKLNGLEVLSLIKSNEELCNLPVIILTTSDKGVDKITSYSLGSEMFISKPISFNGLVNILRTISKHI